MGLKGAVAVAQKYAHRVVVFIGDDQIDGVASVDDICCDVNRASPHGEGRCKRQSAIRFAAVARRGVAVVALLYRIDSTVAAVFVVASTGSEEGYK